MHISDFLRMILQEALRLLDKEYPSIDPVVAEQCIEDSSSYKSFRGKLNQCYNSGGVAEVTEREQQQFRGVFLSSIVKEAGREVEKWKQSLVDDVFNELKFEVIGLVLRKHPNVSHDDMERMFSVSPTFIKARTSIRKNGWKKYQYAAALNETIELYATDISNEIISQIEKSKQR